MSNERLNRIFGIGPKKLLELKRYHNITNITTLRNYVKKFPDLLTDSQKLGLKYYKYLKKKIPYKEAVEHMKFISKTIKGTIPTGSFRRERPLLNDLDIITVVPIDKVIELLIKKGYIIDVLHKGEINATVLVVLGDNIRQLDIFFTTKANIIYTLLYTTGNKLFNIYTRKIAKKMGYSLSQNGMLHIKTNKYITSMSTEKDIFKFLKIEYLEPKNREIINTAI